MTNKEKAARFMGEHTILAALALMWAVLALTTEKFARVDNIFSILRESSFIGVSALGMTFCIITGNMDLSTGSLIALLALVNVLLLGVLNSPIVFAIVLVLGAALGAFNGFVVAKLKIPAFITTLATFYIFRAAAYIVSAGRPAMYGEEWFIWFGNGDIASVPAPFILFALLALLTSLILRRTVVGRSTLAIGNSRGASEISGIKVDRTIVFSFFMVGLFTAISAILISSRLWSANPKMQNGYEFKVIAAVVLGGTALEGGRGSILNTFVASIFYVTINNAMILYHLDSYVISVVTGLILLLAFSLNPIKTMIDDYSSRTRASRDGAK